VIQKVLFLASNFILLQMPNDKSIFHGKTLCAHSICRREFFVWKFLTFENISMDLKIKGTYARKSQKHHSPIQQLTLVACIL
jgi:hypothetical protein